MDKCCGNCGHYAPGNYKSGICCNVNSPNCADFMSADDGCEVWEAKEDA